MDVNPKPIYDNLIKGQKYVNYNGSKAEIIYGHKGTDGKIEAITLKLKGDQIKNVPINDPKIKPWQSRTAKIMQKLGEPCSKIDWKMGGIVETLRQLRKDMSVMIKKPEKEPINARITNVDDGSAEANTGAKRENVMTFKQEDLDDAKVEIRTTPQMDQEGLHTRVDEEAEPPKRRGSLLQEGLSRAKKLLRKKTSGESEKFIKKSLEDEGKNREVSEGIIGKDSSEFESVFSYIPNSKLQDFARLIKDGALLEENSILELKMDDNIPRELQGKYTQFVGKFYSQLRPSDQRAIENARYLNDNGIKVGTDEVDEKQFKEFLKTKEGYSLRFLRHIPKEKLQEYITLRKKEQEINAALADIPDAGNVVNIKEREEIEKAREELQKARKEIEQEKMNLKDEIRNLFIPKDEPAKGTPFYNLMERIDKANI